jgi:hypothetical protein
MKKTEKIKTPEILWCGYCKKEIFGLYIVDGKGKYKTEYHISCFLKAHAEDLCEEDIESFEKLELLELDYNEENNEDNVDN